MNRRLIGSRFPYIPVRISLPQGEIAVEALVDTGFDGDIVLPSTAVSTLSTDEPDAFLTWRLADGSDVVAETYVASAELPDLDGSYQVLVSVLGDEPIIGRGLTDRFRVIFDHGQSVIVEL